MLKYKHFFLVFLITSFSVQAIEKIEVTGSRVKRIDVEGPAPILVLDREDLEKSGYNSAGDVLRDTTIAPFGLGRESSGSSVAGEAFASIHGARALVLINGERLVEDPNQEAVDLNLIPIFAVERIEIVKDGSSALYGSDALGGVINFIMKKDFEGGKVYGRYAHPFAKGGSRLEAAGLFGKTFDNGLSVTGVLQYRRNDKILATDRSWSTGLISPTSPYGVFIGSQGSPVLNPLCPESQRNKNGDTCSYDYSEVSSTLPSISQLSSYIRTDYKWKGIRFYTQSLLSYKDVYWLYAPIPGALQLPAGHQWNRFAGQEGHLVFRFADAGNRDVENKSFVYDLTFGAQGYLSSDWDWNWSTKFSKVDKKETSYNLLIKKEITDLVSSGQYDPFAVSGERGDLSNAKYNAHDQNYSHVVASTLDFSGELGPFGVALGAQAFYTGYEEIADENIKTEKILSSAGSDGSGERWVLSTYQEAVLPYSTLEIQGALRSDYYSDFGFTLNPKGAVRWQPFNSLLVRGSVGTSFIAPSMHNLYGSIGVGYPTLIDKVACYNELSQSNAFNNLKNKYGKNDEFIKDFLIDQRKVFYSSDTSEEVREELKNLTKIMTSDQNQYCSPRQYVSRSGGNEDLKETKAVVGSVGTVWQATSNISLTLDAWYIRTSGAPEYGLATGTTDAELEKGSGYVRDRGVLITRDDKKPENPILNSSFERDGKTIVGMETNLLNTGSSTIAGADTSLEIMHPVSLYGGKVFYKNDLTLVAFSSSVGFPGLDPVDNIGKATLPRWKMINTLGWRNRKHEVALKAYTVASVSKTANELEHIPSYTRFDLFYQWNMSSDTSFNMGWSNVLFSTPPFDDSIKQTSKIDEDLHEVRGSYIFAGFIKDI